jgi:transposase
MGRSIKLTAKQFDELDRLRFSTSSANVFRNCLIILMCDIGQTGKVIAKHLGVGTDTVTRVRRLYRKGGVTALRPIKPPGRPSKATPEFIAQMKQAVQSNPIDLGYGFATWSTVRLAEYLARTTGIRFSHDQLCRLLHKEGFSMQRPKHTLKGKRDEMAYQKARRQLQRLKKRR